MQFNCDILRLYISDTSQAFWKLARNQDIWIKSELSDKLKLYFMDFFLLMIDALGNSF